MGSEAARKAWRTRRTRKKKGTAKKKAERKVASIYRWRNLKIAGRFLRKHPQEEGTRTKLWKHLAKRGIRDTKELREMAHHYVRGYMKKEDLPS